MIWSVFKSVLVAGLVLGAVVAKADHAAAAYDFDNEYVGLGFGATLKDAEKSALEACREGFPNAKCEIKNTAAVAIVKSKEGAVYYGFGMKSKADAKRQALDFCLEEAVDCKLDALIQTPGLYAMAVAQKDGRNVGVYLQYGGHGASEVLREAERNCKVQYKIDCTVLRAGAIKGEIKTGRSAVEKPVASQQSCRPNAQTIHCSYQCTNGNCVLTYENGCQMRVQVQPKYDPFSNQWTYPAPSC